jgi:uncharacterized protein
MNTTKYSFLQPIIKRLQLILEKNNVSQCHGIIHAKAVLENAICALVYVNDLSENDVKCVLLAALLHDADDKKFFPNNTNLDNLRNILFDEPDYMVEQIVIMVNLVSSSKNGDRIPENIHEWMLIPRYADRLEALGIIGIARLLIYTMLGNTKLYVDTTPRPKTIDEIFEYATLERYHRYNGKSNSMFDHCFDKLLRLSDFPITNKFLQTEAHKKKQIINQFILLFGNNIITTKNDVKQFIFENDEKVYYDYNLDNI